MFQAFKTFLLAMFHNVINFNLSEMLPTHKHLHKTKLMQYTVGLLSINL